MITPKLCKILNLEVGEKFTTKDDPQCRYRILENGNLIMETALGQIERYPRIAVLQNIIEHPELIVRDPDQKIEVEKYKGKLALSSDEKAFMRLLMRLGLKYVAADRSGSLCGYKNKPYLVRGTFLSDSRTYVTEPEFLPSVTFANSPIYMEDYV